jgi:hypothetical protein
MAARGPSPGSQDDPLLMAAGQAWRGWVLEAVATLPGDANASRNRREHGTGR